MINLIKNGVDSMDQDGQLVIKLYKDQEEILISVEDNGEGIDKDHLSKIFQPYYTTKKDSMGIGLYMTKMIIEKHMHGSIAVERLTPGLRFLIKFRGASTN
jgi:signal transduction histidine kinase